MVFKDGDKYNQRYKERIDEISPNQKNLDDNIKNNLLNQERVKKEKMYKKEFLHYSQGSPGYAGGANIYEKVDPAAIERNSRKDQNENSLKRKADMNKNFNDKINFQQKLYEINDSLGQIKRTENLYRYEKGMNNLNS